MHDASERVTDPDFVVNPDRADSERITDSDRADAAIWLLVSDKALVPSEPS